jgi:hypothetical protein
LAKPVPLHDVYSRASVINLRLVKQLMKTVGNFPARFIGEQVDILAKLARLEGLEKLASILRMAKAETVRVEEEGSSQRERHDQYRAG